MRRPRWNASPAEAIALANLTATHAQLVRSVVQYLQLTGWLVLTLPRGGFPGGKGWSDILAFKAARTLFVEVKVGRDRLSADQIAVRDQLMARQFDVIEARSLDDVVRVEEKS